VGADHVKSSVTIEYNQNSGESSQEIYDPNATAVLTSQTSQDQTTSAPAAGIPGTPSNVPAPPPAAAPGAPPAQSAAVSAQAKSGSVTQGMTSESKTFAVSKTTHHTLEPAGQVKHLAAAVLVDDAVETKTADGKTQETRRKRTPAEMTQLDQLVRAAIGFNMQRGDELSIQNVSFQTPPAEVLIPPTAVQRTLRIIEPWTWLLRYAGLAILFLLIYFLVLRPVKTQVLATLRALPEKSMQASLPAGAAGKDSGKHLTLADLEGELKQELAETNSQVMRTIALKRHLTDKVKREPEGATRLVQSWVRQGGSET
jgi:flagellar M-ring protein FliF